MAKKGKVQGRASKAKPGMHKMPGGHMMKDSEMKKHMGPGMVYSGGEIRKAPKPKKRSK